MKRLTRKTERIFNDEYTQGKLKKMEEKTNKKIKIKRENKEGNVAQYTEEEDIYLYTYIYTSSENKTDEKRRREKHYLSYFSLLPFIFADASHSQRRRL